MAVAGWGIGVAISEDRGKTWQARNAGLPSSSVWSVAFDPGAPAISKDESGSITLIFPDGHTQQIGHDANDLTAALNKLPQVTKTATSNYSVRFFDIGAPITITAPPNAVDIAGKG